MSETNKRPEGRPRAAVIGLGGMGRRHVAALDSLGIPVVGLCDLNRAAAEEFAAGRADAAAVVTDWRDLLALGGVELLCVATNGPSHRDIVLAAAAAKIPYVLCEAPMSTSGAHAREMAAACAAFGTRLAVNLCRRFSPRGLAFREALRAGVVGRPRRFWSVVGAGGVGCVGLHYLDDTAWLFDARAVWVSAELAKNPVPNAHGPRFLDPGGQVSVGYECADGWRFVGDFELSEDVPRAARCIVVGTEGMAETDDFTPPPAGAASVMARPADQRRMPKANLVRPEPVALDLGPALDLVQATAACVADLVGAHEHDTVQAGVASVDVVLGAHLSDRQPGARVALPLHGADLQFDIPLP